jgi:hypothetical protein
VIKLAALASSPLVAVGAIGIAAAALTAPSMPLAPGKVPSAYAPLIERYGNTCPTLSPALLAAQLYVESGFNPRAVSSKGAQGIGQFMPATWASWAVDANQDGHADPFDPSDAIATAAVYDCSLVTDTASVPGNRVDLMLAGYNAGPYAVLQAGGVPVIAETLSYVRRVHTLEPGFGGVVPASSVGARVVAFAYNRLGTPYEWGGDGADGRFDCSGLTQAAYASVGIALPRVARQQWLAGQLVSLAQLQPGDLVFFATDLADPSTIHHVGVYVGYSQMIDAPHTGAVIRFDPIARADYAGAVRPLSSH